MNSKKITVLSIIVLLVVVFVVFDLSQFLTIEYFKLQKAAINEFYQQKPLETVVLYSLIYIAVTGLSLPGAAVLTLIGGAIFGLWFGVLIVSFASTIGATVAFLMSRLLRKDWVQERFGAKLKVINQGIEKDGAFYLFTLRLVPVFPFFVINLVMGLTPIHPRN